MKNKKCKVVLLILCLSLSILFGCTNDSKERDNSDTNTENTDSVDNTENPVNKLKDNDASKEDSTNISGPIVMKVSEAFDLPEKRVWYKVYDYPTAYNSEVGSIYIVENGYVDVYDLPFGTKMEELDGLTVDDIEKQFALLNKHEKITYEYSRDDTGNNVEWEEVIFSSEPHISDRINYFASEPCTVLSKEYVGFGDRESGGYLITENNFGAEVQFVYNDITDDNLEEY